MSGDLTLRTKAALAFAEAAWRRRQAERELARVRHAPTLRAPAFDALCRAIAAEHEAEQAWFATAQQHEAG